MQYVPTRPERTRSVLTFFNHDHASEIPRQIPDPEIPEIPEIPEMVYLAEDRG